MLRAFALSPHRLGALRSALRYPRCSGGGCQTTTLLNRSGLSQRNAASSQGHFLWVTFLLGQQKKSDSEAGRPSKRPLRKWHPGERATIRRYRENQRPRRWIPAYAGMTIKSVQRIRQDQIQGRRWMTRFARPFGAAPAGVLRASRLSCLRRGDDQKRVAHSPRPNTEALDPCLRRDDDQKRESVKQSAPQGAGNKSNAITIASSRPSFAG